MAPEMYEQRYGTGVDIYSFGLCVIEMCTLTTPYSECKNQIALFQKINNGEKPEAFYLIADKNIRDFISLCIKPANERPSAKELLGHSFLVLRDDDVTINQPVLISSPSFPLKTREILDIKAVVESKTIIKITLTVKNPDETKFLVNFDYNTEEEVPEQIAEELMNYIGLNNDSLQVILEALERSISPSSPLKIPEQQRTPSFHGKTEDRILKFPLKLGIQEPGQIKKVMVEITFNLDKDTAENVAEETVQQLGLDTSDYQQILRLIRAKLAEENRLYTSYSGLDLLDIETEYPQTAKNQAYCTTESVTSEIKSCNSYSSKNSSFEVYVKAHFNNEDPFSGTLSPISSFVDTKTSPGKSDEEDSLNNAKTLRGIISRKNVCNDKKDVIQLKEALSVVLDTKIKIDGVYNKKTENMVKVYQAKHNLVVDGIVTPKLWEMIMSKI